MKIYSNFIDFEYCYVYFYNPLSIAVNEIKSWALIYHSKHAFFFFGNNRNNIFFKVRQQTGKMTEQNH